MDCFCCRVGQGEVDRSCRLLTPALSSPRWHNACALPCSKSRRSKDWALYGTVRLPRSVFFVDRSMRTKEVLQMRSSGLERISHVVDRWLATADLHHCLLILLSSRLPKHLFAGNRLLVIFVAVQPDTLVHAADGAMLYRSVMQSMYARHGPLFCNKLRTQAYVKITTTVKHCQASLAK